MGLRNHRNSLRNLTSGGPKSGLARFRLMATSGTGEMPRVATKKHILVLDDNQDMCRLMADWLGALGYRVDTAGGGRAFVRQAAMEAPDVVITDILMPDGDGFEVIEAAKAARQGTKVIAISGGGSYLVGAEYLKLARSIGADAVLMKPFTQHQMIDAVNRVLSS